MIVLKSKKEDIKYEDLFRSLGYELIYNYLGLIQEYDPQQENFSNTASMSQVVQIHQTL